MATPVIMPRQGQSVESCILAKWAKQPGDAVAEGDLLFSYETDKAGFEEYAKVSGTLIAVFAAEGDDIPCLWVDFRAQGPDFSTLHAWRPPFVLSIPATSL